MVGIVVVSHSEELAEGVVALAREMAGEELALEAAGGLGEPGVLGTDAERVRAAIERAMSADGVLVLMDLGSALMSAEFAVDLLADAQGPVRLSEAPLVEGTVAAAVAASGGAPLAEVAAEARGALAMKAAQIGQEEPAGDEPAGAGAAAGAPADAEAKLAVRNEIGLHARPAARFVAVARGFDAEVCVAKAGAGGPVRATSLSDLVSLNARRGDTLVVSANGREAREAVRALEELAESGFGDGIVAAGAVGRSGPETPATPAAPEGPREAQTPPPGPAPAPPASGDVLTGVAACAGVAVGSAHQLVGRISPPPERAAVGVVEERALLERALATARAAIEHDRAQVVQRGGGAEADIFDAHLALLDDDALLEPAQAAIAAGAGAEQAVYDATQQLAARYRALSEPLLRERATDVLDVGRRIINALLGQGSDGAAAGIVIADELTPADAASLDPERVLAVATARGSVTAHAAILARALGLPAVVGLGPGILQIADETTLLLDGERGTVLVDPPADAVRRARAQRERDARRRAAARRQAREPAVMRDGTRIEVFANLGAVGEAETAVGLGAEGVGLLRTEFLFLGRARLPDEDEQTETLRQIAATLEGRPLIVRTLDAGADKPLAALPMPPETNPFLGVRGIRLGLAQPEVLATQLRAILRVAAEYPVRVMLPMVATLGEVLAAREQLDQARTQTGVTAALELGIMVEVPAAALAAARLAEHVDFFSLGTNDLAQYTMAAERGDARLAPLLAGPQPAVLRLVQATVEGASAHGRWVGVCGELAGDPAVAVLLAGLGVTELSMAPALIPEVKVALRQVASLEAARAAALAATEAADSAEARSLGLALL